MDPKYLGSDGESRKRIPRYLSELTTVTFIQQIGAKNASKIEHMEIFAARLSHYNRALPIFTEIAKQYMTHLQTASLWLTSLNGDPRAYDRASYENLDYSIFEGCWIEFENWEPLQDRLHHFCQEITSMKAFKYNGTWQFCYNKSKPGLDWKLVKDETDDLAEMVEMRRSFQALNQFRERNPGIHSKTREEIERMFFYPKSEKVVQCPVVVNRQRLPMVKDWSFEEDAKGVLEGGKGDDCAFGAEDWHPGQLVSEDGTEEMEFDDEKDTLQGARADYYSGGTEAGQGDEVVSSHY